MTARARRIIAEIKTAAPLTGDRGFESRFLQRRVWYEPHTLALPSSCHEERAGTTGFRTGLGSSGG